MQIENRLESLVDKIVADQALHARWLNTFSYLEYVGFRKILKSQKAVRKAAMRSGSKSLRLNSAAPNLTPIFQIHLFAARKPKTISKSLTRTATRAFAERSDAERARLTYGYVTWLVERRHALSESDIARKLGGLLAEETKHLADVEALLLAADPEFSARSTKFMVVEAKLYQIFVDALACQLAHYPATGTGVTR